MIKSHKQIDGPERYWWPGKMTMPTGAIQPVFYCPGFLSMVFYVKKETAPRVFWVVNWRAFYYFSTTFDGRDKSRFATKSEAWFWAAEKMTRSDMPWEWPKRCFSWPEEALLTNDEEFIYLPRQHFLSIGFYATGGALIAANCSGSFWFYYDPFCWITENGYITGHVSRIHTCIFPGFRFAQE